MIAETHQSHSLLSQCRQLLARAVPSAVATTTYICIEDIHTANYIKTRNKKIIDSGQCVFEQPLDFLGESSGWQQLAAYKALFENCVLILPPSLYLLQNLPTANVIQPMEMVTSEIRVGNRTIQYSINTRMDELFPWCTAIVPFAELIRQLMRKETITVPWAVVGEHWLWLMDGRGRYHELPAHHVTPTKTLQELKTGNLLDDLDGYRTHKKAISLFAKLPVKPELEKIDTVLCMLIQTKA